jgi:putative SOS response-associated peptidase YedK
MCGRYRLRRYELAKAVFETLRQIGFDEFSHLKIKWWNVAPSQMLPIVRMDNGERVLACAQWGFVPEWAKEFPKTRPINAKAETVATSGLFRRAFNSRRCLIPADGFYEWQGAKPPKQPYFIHRKDDGLFAFAGLWERWKPDKESEPIDTCTIITTEPNELMRPIHNRMPLIVPQSDYSKWLDNETPGKDVQDILHPYDTDGLEAYPVSTKVNAPKNDGPELYEPIQVRQSLEQDSTG